MAEMRNSLAFDLPSGGLFEEGGAGEAAFAGGDVYGFNDAFVEADIDARECRVGRWYEGHGHHPAAGVKGLSDVREFGELYGAAGVWQCVLILKVQCQGLYGFGDYILIPIGGGKAALYVGEGHAIGAPFVVVNYSDVFFHDEGSYIHPTNLAIARAVPIGKSFLGWGTVTLRPFFSNWWCDPTAFLKFQPSCFRRLIIFLLFLSICNYIHTKTRNVNTICAFIYTLKREKVMRLKCRIMRHKWVIVAAGAHPPAPDLTSCDCLGRAVVRGLLSVWVVEGSISHQRFLVINILRGVGRLWVGGFR